MTKKDYIAIAKLFADRYGTVKDKAAYEMWDGLRADMVDLLSADNPEFRPIQFNNACEDIHTNAWKALE
jgi:hypothetical protein